MMSSGENQPESKKTPLREETLDQVARRFALLGEPMRLRILQSLMAGEKNVGAIVQELNATQANISRHLQSLTEAGFLGRRKEGLQVIYFIQDPSLFDLCHLVCRSLEEKYTAQANLWK